MLELLIAIAGALLGAVGTYIVSLLVNHGIMRVEFV